MKEAPRSEGPLLKCAGQPTLDEVSRQRSVWTTLTPFLIVVLSLGVRIAWLVKHTGIIEHEGAYYARLAENLATGVGWIGLHFEGEQFFYSPGYPLLIAAVRLVLPNAELAGRLVSLLFGSALVVVVFLLASDMYDNRVGYVAAILAALHPVLAGMSITVNSEPTYLCLLFAGVLLVRRAATLGERWRAVIAGILLGLAYLTRAEALLITLFLILWIVIYRWKKERRVAIQLAGCLLTAFAITAAPYVLYLAMATGQFRLEAKSAANFVYGQMILSGESSSEANFGIDQDLTPHGVDMRPSLEVLTQTKVKPMAALRFLMGGIRINGKALINGLLTEKAIGGGALLALVALGLFRTAWNERRAAQEAFLLVLLICLALPLFSLIFFDARYLVPFVVLLIIWSAKGVTELSGWAKGTARAIGGNQRWIARAQAATVFLGMAAYLAFSWQGVKTFSPLVSEDPALRSLGQQMKAQFPANKLRMLDRGPYVAFYSGGTYGPFPFCDEQTALNYIRMQDLDFLVLRQNSGDDLSYYNKWEKEGIPDLKAHLVLQTETRKHQRISVYRWAN